MSCRIIVDSACDLPGELREKYDIRVLPFVINIEDKSYHDGVDITTEEVYEAMRAGKAPSTDQVPARTIESAFREEAEEGNDVIYLSFSSKMSGTYQTACLFAEEIEDEYEDIEIDVVDSRSGSAAIGILAWKTAELLASGMNRESVLARMEELINRIEHIFILDDLEALRRGGRISRSKSFLGNLFSIKPMLTVNAGEIELLQKVRGRSRALQKLVDIFEERCSSISGAVVGIAHADDQQRAEKLKKMIEDLGATVFCKELINSVLGVHLGIGGVGLFFLGD